MKLSKNFNLNEFTHSDTAKLKNIDNSINDVRIIDNIQMLVDNCIQPIRDKFGRVTINSGYRCEALNRAVGGVSTSQHTQGKASDIKCAEKPLKEVFEWAKDNIRFDQLILYPTFIHVSFNKGKNRQQVIIK